MEAEIVAIIPARGGSKGIPRKNIALLCGHPLISHTIRAAKQSKSVNRVFVSTDDYEIETVSRKYGAEVIRRPADISGDEASSENALIHVLNHLHLSEKHLPEITVFLQCTAPLMTSEDIDGVVEALLKENADSAFAVTDFHYFIWKMGPRGFAEAVNHDASEKRARRQDLKPQYIETGSVYAMRTAGFLESGKRFFGKTVFHITPLEHHLEIDESQDLFIAESIMRRKKESRVENELLGKVQKIKLFITDVDGVLTDAGMYYSEKGDELKKFNTRDGMGLALLQKSGIKTAIITSEDTDLVAKRAQKLNVNFLYQGISDKLVCFEGMIRELRISPDEVCYVGDDINDSAIMQAVGLACCPADASTEIKALSHYISTLKGGEGCVREIVDKLLQSD